MRAQPVDLIGGFYKDDSLPWSCQDTVNWLPVAAEVAGTRTVKKFSTPPGLKPWQQIGTGPIRGMHDCEGLRLIVSGRYLYRISNAGVGIPIGVIPGVGRVQMTHNQFQTGFQVLVENGQGGGGYVYTTATDTFAKITDEGYPGSISSDYLDSYLLGVEPQGRFWFHSNLADATDYNTLDRYEAEAAPDRIVGLAVSASEVVVFGQRTTEFYYNAGQATGTFQNRKSSITRGCASRHTIQKLDNTLFWLGDDGVVYRLNGYSAMPVSTRPLEKAISGYNWPEAVAYVWEDRGHKVYYLTFPDGQTFGYDVITGLWHRRESYGMKRWRANHIIAWERKWYVGDFQTGRIFEMDWDYFLEGSQPMVSERISPALSDDQSQLIVPNAELIFDTGSEPTVAPPLLIVGDQPDGVLDDDGGVVPYTATGGVYPLLFEIVSGALPTGRALNSSTGEVSGTFTAAGEFAWVVRVTDFEGRTAIKSDTSKVVSGIVTLSLVTNLPPAGPTGTIAWSPDSQYLAISSASASPYLWVYKRTGDTLALLTLPATGMTSRAQGLAWSPDGNELSVAPEFSVPPFILRRTGDAFVFQTLGNQSPLAQERGLVYSPTGGNLMLTYEAAIYGWSVSAGVYSPTGKSADLPSSSAFSLEASDYARDGSMFMTGLTASPWGALYSASGASLVAQPMVANVSSEVRQPRFSPQSLYVGWATGTTPFVKLYQRTGSSFTFAEVTGIPVADASSATFEWSPTTANFAVGGSQLRIYRRTGTALTINATYPISNVVGISWSPNGQYIAALRGGGTTVLKASLS